MTILSHRDRMNGTEMLRLQVKVWNLDFIESTASDLSDYRQAAEVVSTDTLPNAAITAINEALTVS